MQIILDWWVNILSQSKSKHWKNESPFWRKLQLHKIKKHIETAGVCEQTCTHKKKKAVSTYTKVYREPDGLDHPLVCSQQQ